MAIHVLNTIPPLIQAGISVGQAHLARDLGKPPVMKTALIDIGASMTAITPKTIAELRPLRLGLIEIKRPGGAIIRASSYDVRIAFEPDPQPDQWWLRGRWFDVEAVSAAPASAGVDVLIGQDLLGQIVMSWDGPRWKLLLMY
jgi:hypothetical protein